MIQDSQKTSFDAISNDTANLLVVRPISMSLVFGSHQPFGIRNTRETTTLGPPAVQNLTGGNNFEMSHVTTQKIRAAL